MWGQVQTDCEWGAPRAPSVRALFRDVGATRAVSGFLGDAGVGRMPSQIVLVGGPSVDEDELEEIELWAPVERRGPRSVRKVRRRTDRVRPSRMYLSFVFPFV